MFTGLIEEIGLVKAVQRGANGVLLAINAQEVVRDLTVDASIAVNGVCLTVIEYAETEFKVQAVEETLSKTTVGTLKAGCRINLERALRFSDRLGGHLVQGHVDGVGKVAQVQAQNGGSLLTIAMPENLMKYVIKAGSIAIDGVSLTIARKQDALISIALIPHTLANTTLSDLKPGDAVNIEVDLIGKYVENLLSDSGKSEITEQWLQQMGYE
ncbi:MAG: riboflavin synthase [bacterium]